MKDLISRFRANIITNGTRAFEEEKWDEISIGSLRFQVSSRSSITLPQGLQQ
jgi:molybdenum cofactor sulfurtransferase